MAYEKNDCAKTPMTLEWGAQKFTIAPVEGNQSLVPKAEHVRKFGGSSKRGKGLLKRRGREGMQKSKRKTDFLRSR